MTDPRWRLNNRDYRYGRVCPVCAGPKTLQAAKCWACHVDECRADPVRWASTLPSFRSLLASGVQQ